MTIQRIRQKILNKDYYLSGHAEEEMIDDNLERFDLLNAILNGRIERKLTHDERGTRYRVEGPSTDGRLLHVVCRFKEDSSLVIITVYVL